MALRSQTVAQTSELLPKAQRTRLRLVEAVRDEIQESGGFTAEVAARRASSSPATFYNHFESKQDALMAAYAALMDDLVAFTREQLQIERLLDVGLERFVADWVLAVAAFFRTNSRVFRSAQAALPNSRAMRDIFREREAMALECYTRFVRFGQAARVIRSGDTDTIAQVLMVTSEGWNHRSVLSMHEGDALHAELRNSIVRMLAPEED